MSGFFEGISYRLAKVGVVLALFVGMTMSCIQLYLDFGNQVEDVEEKIGLLVDVALPPAQRAIYTLDDELAYEVATGLMRYDFILQVTLKDELGAEIVSLQREVTESRTRWITQLIRDEYVAYGSKLVIPDDEGSFGYLNVVIDVDRAFASFYEHSILLMSTGLIRSSILVFGLFIAFYYMLTKPLIRINSQINAINPGGRRSRERHTLCQRDISRHKGASCYLRYKRTSTYPSKTGQSLPGTFCSTLRARAGFVLLAH